jgi:hypothetical protein
MNQSIHHIRALYQIPEAAEGHAVPAQSSACCPRVHGQATSASTWGCSVAASVGEPATSRRLNRAAKAIRFIGSSGKQGMGAAFRRSRRDRRRRTHRAYRQEGALSGDADFSYRLSAGPAWPHRMTRLRPIRIVHRRRLRGSPAATPRAKGCSSSLAHFPPALVQPSCAGNLDLLHHVSMRIICSMCYCESRAGAAATVRPMASRFGQGASRAAPRAYPRGLCQGSSQV